MAGGCNLCVTWKLKGSYEDWGKGFCQVEFFLTLLIEAGMLCRKHIIRVNDISNHI